MPQIFCFALLTLVACRGREAFVGQEVKPAPVAQDVEVQRSIALEFALPDTLSGSESTQPLSLHFVLDVTASMDSEIDNLKENVVGFVDKLKEKKISPRLGAIPFRDGVGGAVGGVDDVPEGRLSLTSDIDAFQDFVGKLSSGGGEDVNEAALMAIDESLSDLERNESNPDAKRVIMMVTNAVGHDGNGGGRRNCEIAPALDAFNSLPAERRKQYRFFFSVPEDTGLLCSGFENPLMQMDAILDGILPGLAKKDRGGRIPWPFTKDSLVDTLAAELSKLSSPPEAAICVVRKAALHLGEGILLSMDAPSLAGSYRSYKEGRKLVMSKAWEEEELAALGSGKAKLQVTRCCLTLKAADAGDFSKCDKELFSEEEFSLN